MKKTTIVILLIISMCTSIFLFFQSRDSPSITTIGIGNISIIGNTDKININTSSIEALESLPNIGPVLAKRIVQGRPYSDLEELNRVKGIGEKTIEGLRGKVVVN